MASRRGRGRPQVAPGPCHWQRRYPAGGRHPWAGRRRGNTGKSRPGGGPGRCAQAGHCDCGTLQRGSCRRRNPGTLARIAVLGRPCPFAPPSVGPRSPRLRLPWGVCGCVCVVCRWY
jgi:hypothetical protein